MFFRADKLSSWYIVALCAYAPLVVFGLGMFVLTLFQECQLPYAYVPYGEASGAIRSGEVSGRYTWLSSVFIMSAVCLAAIFYFATRLIVRGSRSHFIHAGFITVGGLSLFGVLYRAITPDKLFECINRDMFMQTVGQVNVFDKLSMDLVGLATLVELIVAVAAMAISVGVALLVIAPNDTPNDDIDSLNEKMAVLRNYLYFGALGLVTGLMAVRNFFHWPQSFVLEEGNTLQALREHYVGQIDALVMYQSMVYVVLLAVLFGIPSAILAYRARNIAREALAKDNQPVTFAGVRAWLEDNKLSASVTDQFAQIGAILSPVLIGSLSNILQSVAL